jgi:hypothetical protein
MEAGRPNRKPSETAGHHDQQPASSASGELNFFFIRRGRGVDNRGFPKHHELCQASQRLTDGTTCQVSLDGAVVNAPEPASVAPLGAGMPGLAAFARRKTAIRGNADS